MNNLDSFCLQRQITDFNVYNGCISSSGVTLYQGPPGSKFSKAKEVPKARVERRICTSFLRVQGMLTRKIFESRLSKMPFPRLWGEILQNSDGQKTTLWHIRGPGHCFCSTAWACPPPPFGPLGLGAPGFARSEPIVVTPLISSRKTSATSNWVQQNFSQT
jgi:hypothetical protein